MLCSDSLGHALFGRIETVRMRPATTGTTSGQQHRAGSEAAMEAGTEGLSSTAPDVREIAGRAINAHPSDYGSPISLWAQERAGGGANALANDSNRQAEGAGFADSLPIVADSLVIE